MAKSGNSIADIAAGMYAYSNILAALLERGISGRGRHIDVSMLESLAEWMGFPMYYALDGAEPPPRAGASHATIFPYGPFAVGDGASVMLAVQNDREWQSFCVQVLQAPELAQDPRYRANAGRNAAREPLRNLIEVCFAALTADQLMRRLDEARIAYARVNSMADLWAHPQLQARKRWTEVSTEAGPIPALLPPGTSMEDAPRMDGVPALGQHTETILAELGLSAQEISDLRTERVV
jgi:itaconate CoA-transferase